MGCPGTVGDIPPLSRPGRCQGARHHILPSNLKKRNNSITNKDKGCDIWSKNGASSLPALKPVAGWGSTKTVHTSAVWELVAQCLQVTWLTGLIITEVLTVWGCCLALFQAVPDVRYFSWDQSQGAATLALVIARGRTCERRESLLIGGNAWLMLLQLKCRKLICTNRDNRIYKQAHIPFSTLCLRQNEISTCLVLHKAQKQNWNFTLQWQLVSFLSLNTE